jgi:hypothetical protein
VSVVTCDIDGVISDCTERYRQLYTGRDEPGWTPDWDRFHGPDMDFEPCHEEYAQLLRMLYLGGWKIYLLTNRIIDLRDRTAAYMARNNVPYHKLLMRDHNQPFAHAKGAHLDSLISRGVKISLGIDDDPAERATYVNRGIPFLYVHRGHHNGEIVVGGSHVSHTSRVVRGEASPVHASER